MLHEQSLKAALDYGKTTVIQLSGSKGNSYIVQVEVIFITALITPFIICFLNGLFLGLRLLPFLFVTQRFAGDMTL